MPVQSKVASAIPKSCVTHLYATNSNNSPTLLDTHFEDENITRPFIFKAMCTKDEMSREVVDKAW